MGTQLAFAYGAYLVDAGFYKEAGYENVDPDSPIMNRILQHAGTGGRWGAGLGAGIGALTGSFLPSDLPFSGTLGGGLVGAGLGGLIGLGAGAGLGGFHGAYDAGLVHALKRRTDPNFDNPHGDDPLHRDSPTSRSMVANAGLGLIGDGLRAGINEGTVDEGFSPLSTFLRPAIAAGLSEFGKHRGNAVEDPAAALASMRG